MPKGIYVLGIIAAVVGIIIFPIIISKDAFAGFIDLLIIILATILVLTTDPRKII